MFRTSVSPGPKGGTSASSGGSVNGEPSQSNRGAQTSRQDAAPKIIRSSVYYRGWGHVQKEQAQEPPVYGFPCLPIVSDRSAACPESGRYSCLLYEYYNIPPGGMSSVPVEISTFFGFLVVTKICWYGGLEVVFLYLAPGCSRSRAAAEALAACSSSGVNAIVIFMSASPHSTGCTHRG